MIPEQNSSNSKKKNLLMTKKNFFNNRQNLVLNDKYKLLNLKFINEFINEKENKSKSNSKSKKNKRTFYQFNELNSSIKDLDIKIKKNNNNALLISTEKRNKGDNIFIEKLNFTSRNSLSHNFDNYIKNEHQNYFKLSKTNKYKIRSLTNKNSFEKIFERSKSIFDKSIKSESEFSEKIIINNNISINKYNNNIPDFFHRASSEKTMNKTLNKTKKNHHNNYSKDLINNIKNYDIQNPEEQHFLCVNFQNQISRLNSLIN